MCVIALAGTESKASLGDGRRILPDHINQMWDSNPHGGGIAWRETLNGVVNVKWEKGLDLNEMLELCAEVPLPYTAHFRIPTVGPRNVICSPLTHPFPIDEECSTAASGTTTSNLLFHNGHWQGWEFNLKDCAFKGGYKIPIGRWSDSRAMAFTAHCLGLGVLDLIGEKAIVFGPRHIWMVASGWTLTADQIWVSNTGWRAQNWQRTGQATETPSSDKEDHTRPQLKPEDGTESGTTTNRTTPTGNTGGTSTTGTGRSTDEAISNWNKAHLPAVYRKKGTRGSSTENPFAKKGRIMIPVTHEIMADAEARFNTKDQHGNRLLSKRKVKRFRKAYEKWTREQRKLEVNTPHMTLTLH